MGPPRAFRRRARLRQAGEVLANTLSRMGLSDQGRRLKIYQAWADAVGPEIAARTEAGAFTRGVLIVKASSPAWQNELTFLRDEIIRRLNRALGSKVVRELKIQSGRLSPALPEDRRAVPHVPLTTEELARTQAASLEIQDPEVRGAFQRMMGMAKRGRGDST